MRSQFATYDSRRCTRCAQLYDECSNKSHKGGRPTEVERLVKLRANGSGYRDPEMKGSFALFIAAWHGKDECVELMLSNMTKWDVAAQKTDGWTALSAAARNGHLKCVKLLIGHMYRSHIEMKTCEGKTAYEWAKERGHTQCVDLFSKLQKLDKELWNEMLYCSQRPTEVERLVKLGANGSGYKRPNVRLLPRLASLLSLRLPLSFPFSLFSS